MITAVISGPRYLPPTSPADAQEIRYRPHKVVYDIAVTGAAAKMRGFAPEDFHDFAEVVPMADAEIVRLQQEEGYAYMR